MTEHPVNKWLADRPIDPRRGLPVPYVQLINPDGSANFAAIDGQKTLDATNARLCGLCGIGLDYWVAFLGGPRSCEHRAFVDPPMHPQCADDATRLCPHIAHPRVPRRPDTDPTVTAPVGFVGDKPDRWGLYVTRSWRTSLQQATNGGVTPVFVPAPAREIRWYGYDSAGVLRPEA